MCEFLDILNHIHTARLQHIKTSSVTCYEYHYQFKPTLMWARVLGYKRPISTQTYVSQRFRASDRLEIGTDGQLTPGPPGRGTLHSSPSQQNWLTSLQSVPSSWHAAAVPIEMVKTHTAAKMRVLAGTNFMFDWLIYVVDEEVRMLLRVLGGICSRLGVPI